MELVRVTPMDGVLLVELDLERARCRMACRFCPERYVDDRRWDFPDAEVDAIVEAFREAVEHDERDVYLESADVLEFAGLQRVVDIALARKRTLFLATPGLKLADRALAKQFAGRDVRFDLTLHGASEAVWEEMTGRPDARAAVHTALDNLSMLGIPFHVSIVVTDVNQDELADTVIHAMRRWSLDSLSIKLFFPDANPQMAAQHPDYPDQFPDLERVWRQLDALSEGGHLPKLQLYNAPFCQVDPGLVDRLPLVVLDCFNAFRAHSLRWCATCEVKDRCTGVHMAYLAKHKLRKPDVAVIRKVISAKPEAVAKRSG